jgi:hypothetical protein
MLAEDCLLYIIIKESKIVFKIGKICPCPGDPLLVVTESTVPACGSAAADYNRRLVFRDGSCCLSTLDRLSHMRCSVLHIRKSEAQTG